MVTAEQNIMCLNKTVMWNLVIMTGNWGICHVLREAVQCIITPGGKYLLSELHVLVPVQSCKILFPHWLITAMPGGGGYLAAPQLALTAVNRTACSSILLQGRFVIFWMPWSWLLNRSHIVNTLVTLCFWNWAQGGGLFWDNDNAFRHPDNSYWMAWLGCLNMDICAIWEISECLDVWLEGVAQWGQAGCFRMSQVPLVPAHRPMSRHLPLGGWIWSWALLVLPHGSCPTQCRREAVMLPAAIPLPMEQRIWFAPLTTA